MITAQILSPEDNLPTLVRYHITLFLDRVFLSGLLVLSTTTAKILSPEVEKLPTIERYHITLFLDRVFLSG